MEGDTKRVRVGGASTAPAGTNAGNRGHDVPSGKDWSSVVLELLQRGYDEGRYVRRPHRFVEQGPDGEHFRILNSRGRTFGVRALPQDRLLGDRLKLGSLFPLSRQAC